MTQYKEVTIGDYSLITVEDLNQLVMNDQYCNEILTQAPKGILGYTIKTSATGLTAYSLTNMATLETSFTCEHDRLISIHFSCPAMIATAATSLPGSLLLRFYIDEENVGSFITEEFRDIVTYTGGLSLSFFSEQNLSAGVHAAKVQYKIVGGSGIGINLEGNAQYPTSVWVEDNGLYTETL